MAALRVAPYTRTEGLTELYEVGEHIAKGGFSEVYKGVNKKTGMVCAMKVMEKSILTGKRGTMVARENEILRRCQHKNILTLYEVVETKTQVCLAMELVTGGDLYDYIVQRRSLTEQEAAKITKCILNAVEYLHGANPPVVHRDIKPENVLIEDIMAEKVKLSDFGLSKILVDPKMVTCTPGGTSFYLPPEIIEGIKKHGAKPRPTNIQDMKSLDLWSTGIVLYILLCGSPPFKGTISSSAERQKLLDQINQGVAFPDHKWAGISDQAKEMVHGLLQLDPRQRLNVRQAVNHPFLAMQDAPPVQLQTPSVLLTEYRSKQEFRDAVNGVCKGADNPKERGAQEETATPATGAAIPQAHKGGFTLKNPLLSKMMRKRKE